MQGWFWTIFRIQSWKLNQNKVESCKLNFETNLEVNWTSLLNYYIIISVAGNCLELAMLAKAFE
jgi:hypothetical protein